MTDVQVSNARRIGFTAAALVAFWVLAWTAYRMASDGYEHLGLFSDETAGYFVVMIGIGLLMAVMPTLLISLSLSDRLVGKPEPCISASGGRCQHSSSLNRVHQAASEVA